MACNCTNTTVCPMSTQLYFNLNLYVLIDPSPKKKYSYMALEYVYMDTVYISEYGS